MPNWCSNRVTVWSDSQDEYNEFKEFVGKEFTGTDKDDVPWSRYQPFSFEAILPMPAELRDIQSPVTIGTKEQQEEYAKKHNRPCPWITQEESDRLDELYDNNNWYDWSIENWGVKWDCSDVQIEDQPSYLEIKYTFDTPWGPPQEIYNLLEAKFPEVHISWFWDEPGMELAGYLK